jgi:hypothetical protein
MSSLASLLSLEVKEDFRIHQAPRYRFGDYSLNPSNVCVVLDNTLLVLYLSLLLPQSQVFTVLVHPSDLQIQIAVGIAANASDYLL